MNKKDILRRALLALPRGLKVNGSAVTGLLPDGRIEILHDTDFGFTAGCEYDRFLVTAECSNEGIFYETFVPNEHRSNRNGESLTPFTVPWDKTDAVAHYISQKTFEMCVLPTMYMDPETRQIRARYFLRLRDDSTQVAYSLFAERAAIGLLFYHAEQITKLCEP